MYKWDLTLLSECDCGPYNQTISHVRGVQIVYSMKQSRTLQTLSNGYGTWISIYDYNLYSTSLLLHPIMY